MPYHEMDGYVIDTNEYNRRRWGKGVGQVSVAETVRVRVVPYSGTESHADEPAQVVVPEGEWIDRPA